MKQINEAIITTIIAVPYLLLLQLNNIHYASSFIINNKQSQISLQQQQMRMDMKMKNKISPSSTAIFSSVGGGRGLESSPFGGTITPEEGGMTLYLKAGEDGASNGDCPFAQYVRIVLEEKKLPYEIRPCTLDTKPSWLIDHYEGKMPALRHLSECYVDSEVIVQYLDFFFPSDPSLTTAILEEESDDDDDNITTMQQAKNTTLRLFPALAKYLKHGENSDELLESNLIAVLTDMEEYLKQSKSDEEDASYFLGKYFSLIDCSLAPKLYHMDIAVQEYKQKNLLSEDIFPNLAAYKNLLFQRPSFVTTCCTKEDIISGWDNARK